MNVLFVDVTVLYIGEIGEGGTRNDDIIGTKKNSSKNRRAMAW